ncbi:MAG: C40 family peptidase [Lachnospiraceae bacterium]|nr:C40 family peptidase [Lachnospiraceae bacterium]
MKKNVIRSSMLAVAALSLLAGGIAAPTSVKEQVTRTSDIVSKAIENSQALDTEINKGTPVSQLAQISTEDTDNKEVAEISAEPSTEIETKEVKVESNQVVANIDSYLNIREEASEDGEVVGKFYNGNVGDVVEKGDEWSLVSSGNAYGYVNNDYLLFGSDAEDYIKNNCDQVARVAADTINVRAEESTDSEVLDLKDQGDALTVLGQENGWYKVAVNDETTGYVSGDYVYIDYIYETAVTIEEEQAAEAARQAELEQQAAEAQAAEQAVTETQTQTAVQQTTEAPATEAATEAPKKEKKETVESTDVVVKEEKTATETVKQESASASGQAVADYAVQFVGNPYVYGGTSLTNGADCSGFVQSVYAHFGYSLSRTAASQAGDGTAVSLDSLQPGDLIFYHGYGHVAIYIGGGQVVHASNPESGIKISAYNYASIDSACRIIK